MTLVPTAVVKVALEKGPNDTLSSGDWTDISAYILDPGVRCRRGRNGDRDEFMPGTISMTLDNSGRDFDPGNPDGLVYAAGGKGLPLCPVTVDLVWAGSTYRRFTGYLESWSQTFTRGEATLVEMTAMDALAYSPSLPSYLWGILIKQLGRVQPDDSYWHLQMDHGFPVLADGSPIKNRSGSGGTAEFRSPLTLLGKPAASLGATDTHPYMTLPEDASILSEAADIMPDGDETDLTVSLFWRNDNTALTTGEVSVVAEMLSPGGSTPRWRVQVEDDGEAHIYTYDAAGTLIDSDSIAGLSRWDTNDNFHQVVIRFTSGSTMKVWFGGYSATLTAAASVYESDLVVGGSPRTNTYVDEVVVIRRSLTDDEVAGINLAAAFGRIWFGFDHSDTAGAFYEAAGRVVTVDDTNEWHLPVADPSEYGYFGLSASQGLPSNLLEALRTIAGPFGAVWVTKGGYYRVRTVDMLDDATWAAHYATVSADFTDSDTTLSGNDYRHAGVSRLGPQLDRIVNAATCTFPYMTTPTDLTTVQILKITAEDDASIDRYGRQSQEFTTLAWHGWPRAAVAVDETIARYAEPVEEFDVIALDATGDSRLCAWLAGTCELELAVTVTYTPPGSDPITATGLNIQHEEWSLSSTKFEGSLRVAKS